MLHIGASDYDLSISQRNGLVECPRAILTCELELERMAFSFVIPSPGWRVAAGFFVRARISTRFQWPMV